MSSSGSVLDRYLSLISHTSSNYGSILASFGLGVVQGIALALGFFALILAASLIALPIKFIGERIFENTYATASSDECGSGQSQERDLEANVGSLEDVRATSVEQVRDNATEERDRIILNNLSYAIDTAMASRAPTQSNDEQIPHANLGPGPLESW